MNKAKIATYVFGAAAAALVAVVVVLIVLSFL